MPIKTKPVRRPMMNEACDFSVLELPASSDKSGCMEVTCFSFRRARLMFSRYESDGALSGLGASAIREVGLSVQFVTQLAVN